jgi:O-antigen/teichoic acid export membrane protein
VLSGIAELGLPIILANSFFYFPQRWKIVWRQIHFYLLVWGVIYSLLLAVLLIYVLPDVARPDLTWIILLNCVPAFLFAPVISIGTRYYQMAQRPMFMALSISITGIIAVVLNLYTIAYLKMGYMGWFVSTFVSTFILALFFVYPVFFKHKISPLFAYRPRFLKKQLKIALPTVPHNYSSYLLNSSDRVIMDRLHVPVREIGKYNLAYLFGGYFDIIGNAVGNAVGPIYIKLYSKRSLQADRDVAFITNWLQLLFITGGFIMALWCREIFEVLIKVKDQGNGYMLAILIIMGYVYRPYYWSVVNRLQFSEKTAELWKITLVAGILNVVLNIILIPVYGTMAAAVTTFFALIYMGFIGYSFNSFKQIESASYQPVIIVLTILVATASVYLLKDIAVAWKVLISLVLIVGFFYFSWTQRFRFKQLQT